MEILKGQHSGATWRKCDLQCHTPRDQSWRGSLELSGGTPELEAARKAWAEKFVEECVGKGLGAIAVTDHHDICFIRYVQDAAQQPDVPLIVFPGIEVSCKDDAQCLALFDPNSSRELWLKLLNMLPGVMPSAPEDSKTCACTNADVTISELFKAVYSDSTLREACILLPHFSDREAYKSLNVDGHHQRFAQLDCSGVYIEKPFSLLSPVTIAKAHGEIPDWGKQRRGIIATGDNRSENWERLGAHGCWIKLGEESVEAIRQALLADEARLAYEQPELPPERIVKLRVQSTLFGPTPVTITFNGGFTALIGGRGSGKSALLEYLRFSLARTENDLPANEAVPREREALLVEETLKEGFVEIELEREGVVERWRRDLEHRDLILVNDATGATTSITLEVARRRFRARAFYQKGLSSTMNDSSTAADQITGIAAAEALDRRREVNQAINNAKRDVTTALQQVAAYWQARLETKQAQDRVNDLKSRLNAITEQLARGGVSAEHLAVLESAPKYGRAESYLEAVRRAIQVDREKTQVFLSKLLPVELGTYSDVESFTEIGQIQQAIGGARKTASSHIEAIKVTLDVVEAAHTRGAIAFNARNERFKQEYETAAEEQRAHKSLIADSQRLAKELQAAEAAAATSRAREEGLADAVLSLTSARGALSALIEELRAILREAANKVEGRSSGMLKARLGRDQAPREYIEALVGLTEGGYISDAQDRCSRWVKAAHQKDQENAWRGICEGILTAYEAKIGHGQAPDPNAELSAKIASVMFGGVELTARQVNRIYQNLDDGRVGRILAATPRDFIVLTYVDEMGREFSFSKASPGQQASALLELLLRQSAGTLIIDQPEDDLDNRVIMKIVEMIRTSKNSRQLVFATHNPNIVVNGDADKIIALRSGDPSSDPNRQSPRAQIDEDGAIETPAVREAITRIMEGGKEAFDLRGRKYRF